jgi:hypothetical protein
MSNKKKAKQVTPYQRLLDSVREYLWTVRAPKTQLMWFYPKAKLNAGWYLTDLYERTKAADQLGYDVVLVAKDDGLHVKYRKLPDTSKLPWALMP